MDTAFEAVIKVTLSTPTGEDLCLDDELVRSELGSHFRSFFG